MLVSEAVRVALFLAVVLAVLGASLVFSWRSLRRRLGGGPPAGRWERRARALVHSLAALGLLCMAHGRFIEPWWLEVTRVRLTSPKLAPASRPVRLIHISDIHSDPVERLEGRLPEVVAAERPDLIVFTGDCLNSPAGLPVFRRCMERLARIAPTFAVRGNWDLWDWKVDFFGGTGVRELGGDAVLLEVAGARLRVTGVSAGGAMPETLSGSAPGELSVFLHHYPDLIYDAARRRVDLYLAGHTHGGQVALPFYGALVTLSRFGKRFESGLYRVEETWLYVNRGIGMEGGIAPRVRFCARPEVTVIELAPEG